jgi:hypothetical protein
MNDIVIRCEDSVALHSNKNARKALVFRAFQRMGSYFLTMPLGPSNETEVLREALLALMSESCFLFISSIFFS